MTLRRIVPVALIAILGFALWAWRRDTAPPPASTPAPSAPSSSAPPLVVESGGDPGVGWQVPSRWSRAESNSMRLATYAIPAASGDHAPTRCAVYYFGPGQGGDAQTNVERWIGEFENPGKPERISRTVDGLPVATVRVRGTYLAHAGMGEDAAVQPRHELYAAIVEGPKGDLFFKLTGPQRSVDAAAGEFEGLLGSLKKK
jgi:hypothetical protein